VETLVGFGREAVVAIVVATDKVRPEVEAAGLPVVRWAEIRPMARGLEAPEPEGPADEPAGQVPHVPRGWVFAAFNGDWRKVGVWAPELAGECEGGWFRGDWPPGYRTCRRHAAGKVFMARSIEQARAAIRRLLRRDGWRGADIGAWPLPLPFEAAWALDHRVAKECDAILDEARLRFRDATAAAKYAAHALASLLEAAGAYAAAGGRGGRHD
jgi:hypothetical protein